MEFKGRKIAVIGAGIEGLSTLKYLAKQGVEAFVLDKKGESEIEDKTLSTIKSTKATVIFGKHYLDSLDKFDVIVRSPSVRPDAHQLAAAAKKGAEITSQTKLFFDFCDAPIIGVTGTKGKGTTASLTYEILRAAGKKVFLCGNIGKPPLDIVNQIKSDSLVILELSSFQLFDLEKSPHLAVVLMVTRDHLDWHKDFGEYVNAKKNITKYQTQRDLVVCNCDYEHSKKIGEVSKGEKYYFSIKEKVAKGAYIDNNKISFDYPKSGQDIELGNVKIPGIHNLQNVLAATLTARLLGVSFDKTQKIVGEFKGLPHRLEFVKEKDQVFYYDDSASTIPETTIAAIKSFKNPKILILGGSSKRADFSFLGNEIANDNVKAVILIGREANKIKEAINKSKYSGQLIKDLDSMKEIVEEAKSIAEPGDVVVLSPACASFDMFKSYEDRGNQFRLALDSLN